MELTPQAVSEAEFREAKRGGYNIRDVDDFLDRVAVGIGQMQERIREAYHRAEAAESRLVDMQHQFDEGRQAAPRGPSENGGVAVPGGEADETLRRTLVLAQRTADATIKEAKDEAARILNEAREDAARAHASVEANAMGDASAAREHAQRDVDWLVSQRDEIAGEIAKLEDHLATQRESIRAGIADLQRLIDDPSSLQLDPAPRMREIGSGEPPAVEASSTPSESFGSSPFASSPPASAAPALPSALGNGQAVGNGFIPGARLSSAALSSSNASPGSSLPPASAPPSGFTPPQNPAPASAAEAQPPFGDAQPPFGDAQPPFGDAQPPFGDAQPPFGDAQPPFGDAQPPFGDAQPPFGDAQPPFGDAQPPFGDLFGAEPERPPLPSREGPSLPEARGPLPSRDPLESRGLPSPESPLDPLPSREPADSRDPLPRREAPNLGALQELPPSMTGGGGNNAQEEPQRLFPSSLGPPPGATGFLPDLPKAPEQEAAEHGGLEPGGFLLGPPPAPPASNDDGLSLPIDGPPPPPPPIGLEDLPDASGIPLDGGSRPSEWGRGVFDDDFDEDGNGTRFGRS